MVSLFPLYCCGGVTLYHSEPINAPLSLLEGSYLHLPPSANTPRLPFNYYQVCLMINFNSSTVAKEVICPQRPSRRAVVIGYVFSLPPPVLALIFVAALLLPSGLNVQVA